MNMAEKLNAIASALQDEDLCAEAMVAEIGEIVYKIKPRNCDRFATDTDAQIAFLNEAWLIGGSNLDRDPFDGWTNEMKSAYSKWLFAPAQEKEGGNNG